MSGRFLIGVKICPVSITQNRKPWIAIEVKLQEQELAQPIKYFLERVETPYAFQIFLNGQKEKKLAKVGNTLVRSVSAARFLAQLP